MSANLNVPSLSAGVFFLLSTSTSLVRGWPLFIIAVGVAFLLTGFFTSDRRSLGIGLLVTIAGGSALVITTGTIASGLVASIGNLWPIVIVVLLVIWLLPLIVKRRQTPETASFDSPDTSEPTEAPSPLD